MKLTSFMAGIFSMSPDTPSDTLAQRYLWLMEQGFQSSDLGEVIFRLPAPLSVHQICAIVALHMAIGMTDLQKQQFLIHEPTLDAVEAHESARDMLTFSPGKESHMALRMVPRFTHEWINAMHAISNAYMAKHI